MDVENSAWLWLGQNPDLSRGASCRTLPCALKLKSSPLSKESVRRRRIRGQWGSKYGGREGGGGGEE